MTQFITVIYWLLLQRCDQLLQALSTAFSIAPFIFASLAVERILSESFIIQLKPISYLNLCTSKQKYRERNSQRSDIFFLLCERKNCRWCIAIKSVNVIASASLHAPLGTRGNLHHWKWAKVHSGGWLLAIKQPAMKPTASHKTEIKWVRQHPGHRFSSEIYWKAHGAGNARVHWFCANTEQMKCNQAMTPQNFHC